MERKQLFHEFCFIIYNSDIEIIFLIPRSDFYYEKYIVVDKKEMMMELYLLLLLLFFLIHLDFITDLMYMGHAVNASLLLSLSYAHALSLALGRDCQ